VKTFDGKSVTLNMPQNFWLIRSPSFDMQIKTQWVRDGLMTHYALTGGLMGNNIVVVRNDGVIDPDAKDKNLVKVFFKGSSGKWERIVKDEGSKVWRDAVIYEHNKNLLPDYKHLKPGNDTWLWYEENWPLFDTHIYRFFFPDGSEISTTGIGGGKSDRPRLAVVIKMWQQPGLSGMCGDFDNVPDNDWPKKGTRGGKALEDPEVQEWFKRHDIAPQELVDYDEPPVSLKPPESRAPFLSLSDARFLSTGQDDSSSAATESSDDPVITNCRPEIKAAAETSCQDLLADEKASCIFDICSTNDTERVVDAHMVEIEEHSLYANQNITLVDTMEVPGRCLDSKGQAYSTIEALAYSNATGDNSCLALLRSLTLAGVQGAQQQTGGACQLVLDDNPGNIGLFDNLPPDMEWGAVIAGQGHGIVDTTTQQDNWVCWRVIE